MMDANGVTLPGNPNLSESIRFARQIGVAVEEKVRTGEIVFRHPSWLRPVRINRRRKDTPRAVIVMLRRIAATVGGVA